MSHPELTIYSIESCSACVAAASYLATKGIPHKVVKVDEDMDAMLFIRDKGHRSFPQIYNGDTLFVAGGYKGLVDHFNKQ